jgi:hypothetical protein
VRGARTLRRCLRYSPNGIEDAYWWLYLEGYEAFDLYPLDKQEAQRYVTSALGSVLDSVTKSRQFDSGLSTGEEPDYSATKTWIKSRLEWTDTGRNKSNREKKLAVGGAGALLGQIPMWQDMARSLGYDEPLTTKLEDSKLLHDGLQGRGWPLPKKAPEDSDLTMLTALQASHLQNLTTEPVPWEEARRFFSMLHDAAWIVPSNEEDRRALDAYQAFQRDIYRLGPLGALTAFMLYHKLVRLTRAQRNKAGSTVDDARI